jgi:alpha-tubulin suppressor-like RCC1 family protein
MELMNSSFYPMLNVKFNQKLSMVACGHTHTLALTLAQGHIYSFGSNSFG